MAVIAGVAFGAVVLALWLSGLFIGRVLAFLALAGLCVLMSMAATAPGYPTGYLLLGVPLAWVIASAPVWIRRWRADRIIARARAMLYPDPSQYKRLGE